jgi:hypothetical protein
MQKSNSVVAVYGTHPQAEAALHAFQSSGFDIVREGGSWRRKR